MYVDSHSHLLPFFLVFSFSTPAPSKIYTLSLHDALPISDLKGPAGLGVGVLLAGLLLVQLLEEEPGEDRKSTRLNSSHTVISYAVFCLKKKNRNDASRTRYNKPRQQ